jgi:hypothetical protein
MQILALSRRTPGVGPEQLAPHSRAEAAAAFALIEAGVIRSVHMCPERPGSMIVLECAGLDEARAVLGRLPMVRDGLIEFELSRMLPYTAIKTLFAAAPGSGSP